MPKYYNEACRLMEVMAANAYIWSSEKVNAKLRPPTVGTLKEDTLEILASQAQSSTQKRETTYFRKPRSFSPNLRNLCSDPIPNPTDLMSDILLGIGQTIYNSG